MEEIRTEIATISGQISLANQKIDTLQSAVNEMKTEVTETVDDLARRVPVVEDRVNDLRKVGWFIVSAILAQFITAVWAIMLVKHGF